MIYPHDTLRIGTCSNPGHSLPRQRTAEKPWGSERVGGQHVVCSVIPYLEDIGGIGQQGGIGFKITRLLIRKACKFGDRGGCRQRYFYRATVVGKIDEPDGA